MAVTFYFHHIKFPLPPRFFIIHDDTKKYEAARSCSVLLTTPLSPQSINI